MNYDNVNEKAFNDKNIDSVEEFVVLKPVRIKAQGATHARPYFIGEKVKLSGMAKKELYLQKQAGPEKDLSQEIKREIALILNPKVPKKGK